MRRFRRSRSAEPSENQEPASGDDRLNQLLEERLDRVEAELRVSTAGASLCSISKVAGSVPAAKYLEGRLALLLQLRRRAATVDEALTAVEDLGAEWEGELQRVTESGFGPDWRAYRAGGVDELDDLAKRLRHETPPGTHSTSEAHPGGR